MSTLPKQGTKKVRAATIIGFLFVLPSLSCAEAPRFARSSAAVDGGRPNGQWSDSSRRSSEDSRDAADDAGTRVYGRFHQTGKATYYARKFNGRRTASGERYDQTKFTAAHRSLSFGTVVRVTCLNNGKTVTVRINDRGPLKNGRIIDLSLAAAKTIGMITAGVVRVGIEIVETGETEKQ